MNPGLWQALLRVFLASLLQRRLATLLSLLAIALGVALGLAVQLIHGAAINEFVRGVRLLSGDAHLQVSGPRSGFAEEVYLAVAMHPDVAEASPVLEIEARLPAHAQSLRILGVDRFRLGAVTPVLLPEVDPDWGARDGRDQRMLALREDSLFLSAAASAALGLSPGDTLEIQSGTRVLSLRVVGGVPAAGHGQVLGVMDVAAAQRLFSQLGRVSRIDLRVREGADPAQVAARLAASLPAGLSVLTPETSTEQVLGLSRAYRVNLTMLAAIALLTGGFLVFSAQWLSVVRRRQSLAFLRALGLERDRLMQALLAEGALLGLLGGLFGVVLAHGLAWSAFRLMGADLGAGYFQGVRPELHMDLLTSILYLGLGGLTGVVGAWLPARTAVRMPVARALRASEEVEQFRMQLHPAWALLCAALAGALCLLPPFAGIPVGGYLAVLASLAAAVLLLPVGVRSVLPLFAGSSSLLIRLAHARLQALPGQAVVAGAGVVASVALAVSMAIMVSSFRDSVDDWLHQVLPADLYVRVSSSAASGFLDEAAQARVASIAGVRAVQPIRYDTVRLADEQWPLTLIARPVQGGSGIPLVSGGVALAAGEVPDGAGQRLRPVWVSEAAADLFGLSLGVDVQLPLGGMLHDFRVAGVWRDYARQHGAVLLELEDYRMLSGDRLINDLAVWLDSKADSGETVMRAVRAAFDDGVVELTLPAEIRAVSLAIFDRTFLITYLMEAVAVMIGLFGISTTFAALAGSRRKEFGMLRHLGLRRSEVGRLLTLEGTMTALVGVLIGLLGGGAIAWILIEVINRQSFHWSMDMSVPWPALLLFACGLVALAALAARLAGAQAMRDSAVKAVREDW